MRLVGLIRCMQYHPSQLAAYLFVRDAAREKQRQAEQAAAAAAARAAKELKAEEAAAAKEVRYWQPHYPGPVRRLPRR